MSRPILIDEADGVCEICLGWRSRPGACRECGAGLPLGRGIEGCTPHHYHLTMINGSVPGRRGIHQELCQECAIQLRLKVYPPDERDPASGNFWPTAETMRAHHG